MKETLVHEPAADEVIYLRQGTEEAERHANKDEKAAADIGGLALLNVSPGLPVDRKSVYPGLVRGAARRGPQNNTDRIALRGMMPEFR